MLNPWIHPNRLIPGSGTCSAGPARPGSCQHGVNHGHLGSSRPVHEPHTQTSETTSIRPTIRSHLTLALLWHSCLDTCTRSWTRYAGSDPKQLAHHLHLCLHLLLLHYLPGYLRSYWQFELVAELESPASPISITTALLLLLSVGKSSYQVYAFLGKFFNFLRLLATARLGNPKW